MSVYAIGFALLSSLGIAICTEFLAWYWVYRKPEYQRLVKEVARRKKQLEEGTKAAERSSKKRTSQHLKTVQEQYKLLVQQGSWQTMKAQLIPSVLFIACLPLILPRLKGVVIAQLPFEPIWFFKAITQQGLEDAKPNDCSASCIFFLAVAATRSIVRKLVPAPELPSIFEAVSND